MSGKRCPEDEAIFKAILEANPTDSTKLYIMDARPRRNAVANQVKGLGTESESNYQNTEINFLNIHNIHAMRDRYDLCPAPLPSGTWGWKFIFYSSHLYTNTIFLA